MHMNRDGWMLLGGVALGAGMMYMLDPDRGRRRRSLARDKFVAAGNKTSLYAGKLSRDLTNRAQGLAAEARSRFRSEQVSDEVLVDRVKAELGRHSIHHRALEISAAGGRITLRGPALSNEVDRLLSAVGSVRGVADVENLLDIHEQADGISALQAEVAPAASS
jgi:osmotically-inducible protein OsmY